MRPLVLFTRLFSHSPVAKFILGASGDASTRLPHRGGSFGVGRSGRRCEPGLQFVPNVVRRRLYALPTPMGIEGIVQQPPGLRLLLKVGEEVDQREIDLLCERGDSFGHIGADGALPGGGLHKPATALGRYILGIDLALRRNVQQGQQDARRPTEVVKLGKSAYPPGKVYSTVQRRASLMTDSSTPIEFIGDMTRRTHLMPRVSEAALLRWLRC
jgi:hypothetical protein